jgi:hypothetical protein
MHYFVHPNLLLPDRADFGACWQPLFDDLLRAHDLPGSPDVATRLRALVRESQGWSLSRPTHKVLTERAVARVCHDLAALQLFHEAKGRLPRLAERIPEAIQVAARPGAVGTTLVVASESITPSLRPPDMVPCRPLSRKARAGRAPPEFSDISVTFP